MASPWKHISSLIITIIRSFKRVKLLNDFSFTCLKMTMYFFLIFVVDRLLKQNWRLRYASLGAKLKLVLGSDVEYQFFGFLVMVSKNSDGDEDWREGKLEVISVLSISQDWFRLTDPTTIIVALLLLGSTWNSFNK